MPDIILPVFRVTVILNGAAQALGHAAALGCLFDRTRELEGITSLLRVFCEL